MIEDIKNIQDSLGSNFKGLKKIMDAHLNQLPEEHQKKLNPIRADIAQIVKEIKKGNVDAINKIHQKYADIRR
jgi:hypothetical protein